MLTKEKFISSCNKIPFSKVKIEGLGEVGLRLFRKGEPEQIEDKTLEEQIGFVLIGDDNERIFSDEDISIIENDFPFAYKKEIMEKLNFVNGLEYSQDDIKKN